MLGALLCWLKYTVMFTLVLLLAQLIPEVFEGDISAVLTLIKTGHVVGAALFYGCIIGVICMSHNYGGTPLSTRRGAPDVNPTTGNQMATDSLDVAGNAYGAPPRDSPPRD